MADKAHQDEKERGVIMALLERLEHQRIPRLLEMEKQVEAGAKLTDAELDFLAQLMEDWKQYGHRMAEHEKLRPLLMRVIDLYHSITQKALANERAEE